MAQPAQPPAATKPTSTFGDDAKVSPEQKRPRAQEGAEAAEEPIPAALADSQERLVSVSPRGMENPRMLIPPLFAGGFHHAGMTNVPSAPVADALREGVPVDSSSDDEGNVHRGNAAEHAPSREEQLRAYQMRLRALQTEFPGCSLDPDEARSSGPRRRVKRFPSRRRSAPRTPVKSKGKPRRSSLTEDLESLINRDSDDGPRQTYPQTFAIYTPRSSPRSVSPAPTERLAVELAEAEQAIAATSLRHAELESHMREMAANAFRMEQTANIGAAIQKSEGSHSCGPCPS